KHVSNHCRTIEWIRMVRKQLGFVRELRFFCGGNGLYHLESQGIFQRLVEDDAFSWRELVIGGRLVTRRLDYRKDRGRIGLRHPFEGNGQWIAACAQSESRLDLFDDSAIIGKACIEGSARRRYR